MTPTTYRTPDDPGPGPGGLYTVARLAARLGIAPGTLRQHVANRVPWLPQPDRVGRELVWTSEQAEAAEASRRAPGRPRTRPGTAPDTGAGEQQRA